MHMIMSLAIKYHKLGGRLLFFFFFFFTIRKFELLKKGIRCMAAATYIGEKKKRVGSFGACVFKRTLYQDYIINTCVMYTENLYVFSLILSLFLL